MADITFSDRVKLEALFYKWCGKSMVHSPINFLAFLKVYGMLDAKAVHKYFKKMENKKEEQ